MYKSFTYFSTAYRTHAAVVSDTYLEEVGVCFMSMSFRLPVLQECIGVLMEWMGESPLMSEFTSLSLEVLRRGDFGLGVCLFICVFPLPNAKNLYKFIMVSLKFRCTCVESYKFKTKKELFFFTFLCVYTSCKKNKL